MPSLVTAVVEPGGMRDREQPVLRVDELTLRPWRPDDVDGLIDAYRAPDIQQWHLQVIEDEREALDYIDRWQRHWHAEKGAGWAVVDTDSGELLGQLSLWGISLLWGFGEFSYWVRPQARGRRVAIRAARAVVDWAFDDLGLNRLEIKHALSNETSCLVAAKLGFDLEGTMTRVIRHADGWHDMHLHALVRPE